MNKPILIWGIILAVGFALSHWLVVEVGFNASWLWIGWAIIFNIGFYMLGKSMKKSSKNMKNLWMQIGLFGFVVTLILSLGLVFISLVFLMSFWFLLIGSVMFSGGHESRNAMMISTSLIFMFSSVYTLAFGSSYFLLGALVMGLLTIFNGIFMEK